MKNMTKAIFFMILFALIIIALALVDSFRAKRADQMETWFRNILR